MELQSKSPPVTTRRRGAKFRVPVFVGRPPRRAALGIALIYAAFGVAWIYYSDVVLRALVGPEAFHRYHVLQTIKGWFFIVATAVLLYWLVRRTVTAFRWTDRARHESEAKSRFVVERVRDYAIFTLDENGNVASWNRGAQQVTDWGEEEILCKPLEVFYSPQDVEADKPYEALAQARKEGWSEHEAQCIRQDGTEFWAHVEITALRDPLEGGPGFLVALHDVTERRRAQASVRELNQTLITIIAASPLAIITLDPEGKVLSWNPAAQRLFGWTEDEVRGNRLPIIPEHRLPIFYANNEKLKSGQHIEGDDLPCLRKDGSTVYTGLWAAPLEDWEGRIIGNVRLYADIDDRRRAEQEIHRLNETLERRVAERTALLEETNEELQAFSYTVSHDMRIPLRSLRAIGQHLLTTQAQRLDEAGQSDALRIIGAAARMERQVEDLLEYSRVSRDELKLERVSLVLVVHQLVGRLERDPAYRDAQVTVTEPLGWVKAHPLTLQHVILNLLVNAITYVAPGIRPAVNIRSEQHGGRVRLWIEDNAVGIPAANREAVFHAFDPGKGSPQQAGLGLTVVRRGIERMGGKVGMESCPNGGSRFWIELPSAE